MNMKKRTIARLVGAALAGGALMALPVTTMAAVVKTYPVTLTLTPGPGQTPKVSLFEYYALQLDAKSATATPMASASHYIALTKVNISAAGICSITGSPSSGTGRVEVRINNTGACTITASINAADVVTGQNMRGDAQYTFQVSKADMRFAEYDKPLPATALVGDTGTYFINTSYNPAKSSPSASISSLTPAICSAEIVRAGGLDPLTTTYAFKALAAGICTISYSTPETDEFRAFSTTKTVTITDPKAPAALKGEQSIAFPAFAAPLVGQSVTLSASGGDSGNPVTFSSKTPTICSVEGTKLTALAVGTCTVAADQLGNDKFSDATQKTQELSIAAGDAPPPDVPVGKPPQAITFAPLSALAVGATASLTASGGDSGNAVTFSSLTPDICTVSGNQVSAVAAGSCTVAADQAGNDSFAAAAQATQTLTVSAADGAAAKTTQSITIFPLSPVLVGSTATINAKGGDSGNPLTLSSSTTDICTVSGSTLTAVAAGTCTVAASQDGNDTFEAAKQATLNVSIVTEITPFSVNVSVAGDLSAQTVIATINPASSDAGKNGSEFLAAQLGDMVFLYGAGGWVQYSGADSVVALSSGALASHELTLLDNIDMTPLVGAQIFVGYGLGNSLAEAYDDMQKAGRLMSAYKVE
ncbi:MAG: hypothetical protein KGZ83_12670 [Sulfuricella sp.]|nr:hypothetical protein [Sulfuricella sp.]